MHENPNMMGPESAEDGGRKPHEEAVEKSEWTPLVNRPPIVRPKN